MSARTRGDWILWGALGCTLVVTAHAEYTLAVATGVHWIVAGAVPGALDLYVIRALQVHRDVLTAVVVMVAVNVASHLVAAGVLEVHWALISAVGALAPVLLWRIHYLMRVHPNEAAARWRLRRLWGLKHDAPEECTPECTPGPSAGAVNAPVLDSDDTLWVPEWMQEEVRRTHPSALPGAPVDEAHPGAGAPGAASDAAPGSARPEGAPALHIVGAPPSAPEDDAPGDEKPHPEDLMKARTLDMADRRRTSMRALRKQFGWGQNRATEVRRRLNAEYERNGVPWASS